MQTYVQQSGYSVSPWLRVGGMKAFADGSLGSRTALFHEVFIILSFFYWTNCMKIQLLNWYSKETGAVSISENI